MIEETEPLITFSEALQYLKQVNPTSSSRLYDICAAKEIAHYKPNGRNIKFKKSDLIAWVEGQRIEAKPAQPVNQG